MKNYKLHEIYAKKNGYIMICPSRMPRVKKKRLKRKMYLMLNIDYQLS